MQGISKYGALATKVRGMRSYLLTDEELIKVAGMSSVKEIASYLKNRPGYRRALATLDPENMRRETFERLLIYSAVRDVRKIYMFLNHEQRQYFDSFFIRFEVRFLNNCIRNIFNKYTSPVDLSIYRRMFTVRHSKFDFDAVIYVRTMSDFMQALRNTIYYEPLKRLITLNPEPSLFEYQRCLDMFYYTNLWNALKKIGDKYDKKVLLATNGEDIDLLNLLCMYRIKAHFDVSEKDVFYYLIPAYYKLKYNQVVELAACKTLEEFLNACKKTYYGRFIDLGDPESLEHSYAARRSSTYDKSRRNFPYSFAVVDAFIFNKRVEIENLISIAESVRYGYPQKTILENLNIGGERQ